MIPVALAGIEIFLNFEVLRPILGSGAIPWALIVSAVNIGFAFYMGRMCITNLMHPVRTSSRPSNYFILIIFILALIVYVNFFMGVFRGLNEAADLIPRSNVAAFLQAKTDAMYDALQPWNHLNDINAGSVQLLFLAITFSFASMVDGYFFDDPINGYGSLGRKVARAKTKLKEITKQGQVQVTSFIARANDVLDKKRELRDKANHDWYEIIQAYDAANKDHFPNFNESIKGNIEAAINTYREKNVIFRTEALPEFMNNPIDTSFIKDFPSMHQGVVFHLIDDPEIEKIYRENNELINKEYVETKGLYTEHFGREQDEVYARIREVNLG